jgi:exodeoxyribonuclease VII small subunit
VAALERGEAPLDKLLALYEEGAGLVKTCNKLLDSAEQTVVRLSKGDSGEPIEAPFEADE